jgi:UDPglucose 6-dehydrogenase
VRTSRSGTLWLPTRFAYNVDFLSADADVAILDGVHAGPLTAGMPRLVTDFPTAHLITVAANALRATRISFINATAEVCQAAGDDLMRFADARGLDDRIGCTFLNAEVGFSGGCLPKDICAFVAWGSDLGAEAAPEILREIDPIDLSRQSRMATSLGEQGERTFVGKRMAVLGSAFKTEREGIRDSPALDVGQAARSQGTVATIHDPRTMEAAQRANPPEYATWSRRPASMPTLCGNCPGGAVPRDRPGQSRCG